MSLQISMTESLTEKHKISLLANFPKERQERPPIEVLKRKKNPVLIQVEKVLEDCINDPDLVGSI